MRLGHSLTMLQISSQLLHWASLFLKRIVYKLKGICNRLVSPNLGIKSVHGFSLNSYYFAVDGTGTFKCCPISLVRFLFCKCIEVTGAIFFIFSLLD